MVKDKKPTRDDVARLIRGKPSRSRVGSRAIAHRLRKDELEKFSIAKQRGYLLTHVNTRPALINSWYLWCLANKTKCKIKKRVGENVEILELTQEELS